MGLRVEIAGVAEVRARLRELADQLDDMTPLWEDYAAIMAETEEEQFATAGHGLWPPLARTTLREKLRYGWPPDPLIRTGALVESLTDPGQAMEIGQGRSTMGTFTRKAMSWGTDVRDERGREYAHYHQHTDPVTGEPAAYGDHPPERQVIPWPLPPHTAEAFQAANEEFVRGAIERSQL